MSWLQEPPAPAPPEPGHVNIEWLMQMLQAKPEGSLTLADKYLMTQGPRAQLDKWGNPLPLCPSDQDRLDRVFAVVASPYDRTRALLRAGMLAPDEVDAVSQTFPEIYGELEREALRDMVTTEPPYRGWAETVLGILFQKPAPEAVTSGAGQPEQPEQDDKQPSDKPGKAASEMAQGMATQADRRDVEVREQRNS